MTRLPAPGTSLSHFLRIAAVTVAVFWQTAMSPSSTHALPPPGGTINLVAQLPLPNPVIRNSDIWGWVDPNTSKEYAIVGKWPSVDSQVFIIDVSDPVNPSLTTTLSNVPAFDMKTWGTYLYLCDGNSTGTDSEIWNIADPANPVFAGSFPSCHNIFIDDQGLMYLSFNTLRIYDLKPDPTSPTFVWTDGISGGHDVAVVGPWLYDFHGYEGTFIYDITTPSMPSLMGTIAAGSGIVYHHSGWTSSDGKFLFINDELGSATTPDITVWNIANPAVPFKVAEYTDPDATVHNSFRVGNYLYSSFYVAGFRVFDIGNPVLFYLADEFDTSGFTGNGLYEGCWGVYPFAPSGNIYASDMQNGLLIFTFSPPVPTGISEKVPTPFVLDQNYPNPFNPTTTIPYTLTTASRVTLTVFSATGERVRAMVDEFRPAGTGFVTWNGTDDAGQPVASGAYFYRLRANGVSDTRQMILLK
ncbi:MAG: T9SS type A sorting domain-containing protein [Candidatus Krumholzibacteria bacterium]|nr:T9SS type A sorting domain-containing protein [Candidatus Krumholzibacteria bacterium]